MKLNINKACDLSSISVLPPHSRILSAMNSGADASGFGRNQASQLRSLSQQSFSQGLSQSQITQNSFEENLGSDQKIDTQERERSSKRISSLAQGLATRDESQMQLSRTSNNVIRRWSVTPASDNRCQVSEELELRLRFLESSLSKLGMILDSLQSDVMQINRAVKEVSLEMEGTRQKANILDNTIHQVLKEEEDIKALLDRNMKLISDQMMKEADRNKLNEISSAISAFPKQIETQLMEFRHEICVVISKNMQVIANNTRSFMDNLPDAILSREAKIWPTRRQQNCQTSKFEIPVISPPGHKRRDAVFIKEEALKTLEPKLSSYRKSAIIKHEEISLVPQILIESDEESGGLCCILAKKGTNALSKESQLEKEAKEETMRILRKARKRKRRQSNFITIT